MGPLVRLGGFQVVLSSNGSASVSALQPHMAPPEVLQRLWGQRPPGPNTPGSFLGPGPQGDLSPEDLQEMLSDPDNQQRIKVMT